MDKSLSAAFSSLPPLSKNEFNKLSAKCKICGADSHFFDVIDFAVFRQTRTNLDMPLV